MIAPISGSIPPNFTPTWAMFISRVFRDYFGTGARPFYREIADCFYNSTFLVLVRE